MTLYSKLICIHFALISFCVFMALEAQANHMGLFPVFFLVCAGACLAESFRLVRCIEKGEG